MNMIREKGRFTVKEGEYNSQTGQFIIQNLYQYQPLYWRMWSEIYIQNNANLNIYVLIYQY